MDLMLIHKRILAELKAQGKHQKDLVKDMGLTQTGFRHMFEHETVKFTVLVRIANWFDEPLSWLLGFTAKPTIAPSLEQRLAAIESRLDKIGV